jgi:hypothetical protein
MDRKESKSVNELRRKKQFRRSGGYYLPIQFLFTYGFPEIQLPGDNAARHQQHLALLK